MTAPGGQPTASGRAAPPVDAAAWVRAAAAGDAAAWTRLVNQYDGLVWAVARSFRLNSSDAADVVQTTWLRLVEHLDRIEQAERVSAWLVTTARRECLGLLRRQTHQAPAPLASLELIEDKGPALDHGLLTGERDSAVWAAFGRLSERCQRLLRVLVADPPPSYEDVGLALDMPIGSIGPTRSRCLDQLRRVIGIEGAGPLLLEPS